MNLNRIFNTGKNPKWKYFLKGYLRELLPDFISKRHASSILKDVELRGDFEYIKARVDYYNKLESFTCCCHTVPLFFFKRKNVDKVSTYYFDTKELTVCFPSDYRLEYKFGDITKVPEEPAILKSRPIEGDNANSVLLKLDKVRHFIFVADKISFADKIDKAIFRGKVEGKILRKRFFEKYFGNPLCDLGDTSKHSSDPQEWKTFKITLFEQLKYKFILSLEGNDVASNLKWVMSSNSLAVMPRPVYETWFMEGKLIPDYHYVEIKPDFSDLEEKMNYYSTHLEESMEIIRHANEYVSQFKDEKREKIISLLVLKKYFEKTNTYNK